jgi:hypothetical protein
MHNPSANHATSSSSAIAIAIALAIAISTRTVSHAVDLADLAPAAIEGNWLRPAAAKDAVPRWGHAAGLQVGVAPLPGPRGLLRIYAPYLDHPEHVMINFIAIEPIPQGETERGLSELEFSKLDNVRGKRFWTADDLADLTPQQPTHPARGVIETVDGVECLRVYILAESFENGAHVAVRLTFRADRPHEVALATYAHEDSAPLDHCILTATMGNYARLRELHLADRVVTPGELWPDYDGNEFTPHARFPLADLQRTADGAAFVVATTDEPNPQQAEYAFLTRRHWRYQGKPALQRWQVADPDPKLEALVNGRRVYWGSLSPIPGGVSYENFELVAPFKQGGEFTFSVEPIEQN